MEATILCLNAGERNIRGTKRKCCLLATVQGERFKVVLIEDPPPDTITIPITLTSFKQMMKQHQLTFRKRKYKTEAERKRGMRKSLERYRKGEKYQSALLLNKQRKSRKVVGDLSQEVIDQIKASDKTWAVIVRQHRKHGVTLKEVREIKQGDPLNVNQRRRLLGGNRSLDRSPARNKDGMARSTDRKEGSG